MDIKILELKKKIIDILEKTKNVKTAKTLREEIFELSKQSDEEIEDKYKDVSNSIDMAERYINFIKKIMESTEDFEFIKKLGIDILQQKARKEDNIKSILFKVIDKDNVENIFITRIDAEKFVKENKESFSDKSIVEVIDNKDQRLNKLLKILTEYV